MRLEIKDVSKQYPKTLALDHVSAELSSGLYGLLLFVNGFRQPYRTKEQIANSVLHYFDVGQNEHKIQTIEFEPIVGEKGDVLSVEILSMFCPSYIFQQLIKLLLGQCQSSDSGSLTRTV